MDFVTIWQSSKDIAEVANRINAIAAEAMPRPIIHARASSYRRMGVKLKPMPRVRLDIAELNQIPHQAQPTTP